MSPRRAGFTLFELMLVMMIILVAAGLSIPVIESLMADGRVKAGRDIVRARWADIRGLAMKEGRPYKFSVIDNTGKFKIEPEDSTNTDSDSDDPPTILEGELPEQVLFNIGQSTLADNASGASSGSDYTSIVVYLADGTARDDVTIMLGKAGDRPIGLQLRALTGSVTMVDAPTSGSTP